MEIGDWSGTKGLNALYRTIRSLDLEPNVAELEAFGFTIIEDALPKETVVRLRDKIFAQALGRGLDLDQTKGMSFVPYLLFQDPAFEDATLNPKPLALITYLLGQSCLLSHVASFVKSPGGPEFQLHCDGADGVPPPFPTYSRVANCNYALADYTEAGGALAVVPGSHRLCRSPLSHERHLSGPERNPDAIAVEVPAGSAIIWHANTWHGSFRRNEPGLRANLAVFFCRRYMRPLEDYRGHIPEEAMARLGDGSRLATLLDLNSRYGWGPEGPKIGASYVEALNWHT